MKARFCALLAIPACLMAGGVNAEQAGAITEFPIAWPSAERNATHELLPDAKRGVLWTTGLKQDHVARIEQDGKMSYIALPPKSAPHGMALDKQGRLWVSLEGAGAVVRLDDKGAVAESIDVKIRSAGGAEPVNPTPHAIAFGLDGRTIWFTGKTAASVGRIDPSGQVTHFALKTPNATPIYLALGPDGNIWGTQLIGNHIFRITPDGKLSEFPIPTPNSRPIAIVAGPDKKSMWFSEEAGVKIARIDMNGVITEYPIPRTSPDSLLAALTFDRQGNLWTQMYSPLPHSADMHMAAHGGSGYGDAAKPAAANAPAPDDFIVKLDKSIVASGAGDISRVGMTYFKTPSRSTIMHRITQGPDRNIWFTELNGDRVARLTLPATK